MGNPKTKKLFVGDFRYSGELITRHAHAFSGRQAKIFMMQRLAKEHEVSFAAVCAIFNGSRPNFNIQVDPEWREKIEI